MLYIPKPYLLKDGMPCKLNLTHLMVFAVLVSKANDLKALDSNLSGMVEITYTEINKYVHKSKRFMTDCMNRLEQNGMIKRHHSNGEPVLYEILPESNYFKSEEEIKRIEKEIMEGMYNVQ